MSINIQKSFRNCRKQRFSDDQIKSLETTFKTEARPELRLKHHLANKLGLQPRQIAIWFQNKRARSKSKQIEQEYSVLKSNYDHLALQFEALRKENQTLLIQVQKLRKKADCEENDKNTLKLAASEIPRLLLDINGNEICGELKGRVDYLEEEADADVLYMAQIAESSLPSPQDSCSLESCNFLDNTGGSAQWWDF
ncbi:homeobox-leucine zipper protein ATHB-12-like [Salvia hispanica]|uniref:homeobox-leucine zipper protein ATHB-12-like n=1 Tax=Salvia hispanica TaxID=49212 RepID=UPI002009BB11|nr:homeobox-leucine zipper protein ATHB-12-like [Salvia hispanica]